MHLTGLNFIRAAAYERKREQRRRELRAAFVFTIALASLWGVNWLIDSIDGVIS